MRLFMAIPIVGPVARALADVQQKLAQPRADVRWVQPARFHITVKFLGETDETLVPELSRRLTKAAAETPPLTLDIEGLDPLPLKGPPRVIIAHALSRDHHLTRLHRLIDSGVGGMGLPMDTRELLGHITLGRVVSNRGINKVLRLLDKFSFTSFGRCAVQQVGLYESIPSAEPAQAARYRLVHAAELPAER